MWCEQLIPDILATDRTLSNKDNMLYFQGQIQGQ